MYRLVLYCLSMLLLLPCPSQAASAISCHCFTDRSYDPSRPALADPYFLATTQNSFFAALFSVDKKTIVMKKQSGSSADDLWIAYWIASRTGLTGEALLTAREKKRSWKEAVVALGLPAKSVGVRLASDIATGTSPARLAQDIVDDVLVRFRLIGEQELATLRKEWASNQEVIIASLIAVKSGRPAIQIYRDVKRGSKSWGALLGEAKIQSSGIQSEFAALLNSSPR